MVDEKVNIYFLSNPSKFIYSFQSKITTQIVNSLVNQQQDALRGIIEDFEEKVN